MSAEFVDTNVFVYAHDGGSGPKHDAAVALLTRLFETGAGAISVQVLTEFYAAATRKLRMDATEAAEVIADLGGWLIHRPAHADVLRATVLVREHGLSWWDALIVNSAAELGCAILWSEDLADGRKYGSVTVRNPFAASG